MPWKEIKPMDQRIHMIVDWETLNLTITELSLKYNVSRKSVYKWISRYQQIGIDGLKELSRAPINRPHKTSDEIIDLIIAQKLQNRKRGPKKIHAILKQRHPDIEIPVPSTVGYWLKKNGLVMPKKIRRRVPNYTEPFIACKSPNAVWSADFKGQFYMKNGKVCYPLTISDNYSRYLLACQGFSGPRYKETRDVFEATFREYGLPEAIRTDNGTPFAGKSAGALSRLSIWWIQLGVIPERIDKGCPEQNGRHERMHKTLKNEALDPVAFDIKEQQKQFDLFRMEFNYNRPHEAFNQQMPAQHYQKSTRPYVENPPKPCYDYSFTVRKVKHKGEIKFKARTYYLTQLLAGQHIGLNQINDDQWKIYYYFQPIAIMDLRKNKLIKI
ncbi:integrase core domain-containing protein [Candidatus Auribacterota bacterium]